MRPEQDQFLESLFREYFHDLLRYAMSHLKDQGRAEEIVQDTFHEAVTHIDALMAHDDPKRWLKRTAKNKIRNSERTRLRYIRRFLSLDAEEIEKIPDSYSLEEEVHKREAVPVDERLERSLTEKELHLLKRISVENASHLEISQELGISIWASQKRLERIRKKLEPIFPEKK